MVWFWSRNCTLHVKCLWTRKVVDGLDMNMHIVDGKIMDTEKCGHMNQGFVDEDLVDEVLCSRFCGWRFGSHLHQPPPLYPYSRLPPSPPQPPPPPPSFPRDWASRIYQLRRASWEDGGLRSPLHDLKKGKIINTILLTTSILSITILSTMLSSITQFS